MKSLKFIITGLILFGATMVFFQSKARTQSTAPMETTMVVYANLSCTMPDGKDGCECTITTSDDDCSLQTDCTASSSLPNYHLVLNQMFTPGEIATRATNQVRITEVPLKQALINDGFPLKP